MNTQTRQTAQAVCLHQLSTIGVPVIIVETVQFSGSNAIEYHGRHFADYRWLEDGTPYFHFSSCVPNVYTELQSRWFADNFARLNKEAKS